MYGCDNGSLNVFPYQRFKLTKFSYNLMPRPVVIPPNARYEPVNPALVGNFTQSKDPNVMKARVFAGCLNTQQCTRQDVIELFSMYGPLTGVTHFGRGGFAYIQFQNVSDAHDAIYNLHKFKFQDCKIATAGEKFLHAPSKSLSLEAKRKHIGPRGESKRTKFGDPNFSGPMYTDQDDVYFGEGTYEMGPDGQYIGFDDGTSLMPSCSQVDELTYTDGYNDNEYLDWQGQYSDTYADPNVPNLLPPAIAEPSFAPPPLEAPPIVEHSQPLRRQSTYMQRPVQTLRKEESEVEEYRTIHSKYEIPDMFVCGGCHLITANAQQFMQHRLKPCDKKQIFKSVVEPEELSCYMCTEKMSNSWDLLVHLGRKHCLYLFNETLAVNELRPNNTSENRPRRR